ncbi:hypothetical protein BZA05DRAFT_458201 [Tricharina praecox]|uniref:uncharacterized protein n=1 Tax=Tricharina praecox TaxID=43433 RepID=UPI002220B197|nr:uncharacterized protein BZA05DRAFT_458201 [Tricharina praecox]KAI5846715.1 hypothetical protein BZA05DRAFT_458201 [Tricharina praecox]
MPHRRQAHGSSRSNSPERAHGPRRQPPTMPKEYGAAAGAPAQHFPSRIPRPATNGHHHTYHPYTHTRTHVTYASSHSSDEAPSDDDSLAEFVRAVRAGKHAYTPPPPPRRATPRPGNHHSPGGPGGDCIPPGVQQRPAAAVGHGYPPDMPEALRRWLEGGRRGGADGGDGRGGRNGEGETAESEETMDSERGGARGARGGHGRAPAMRDPQRGGGRHQRY